MENKNLKETAALLVIDMQLVAFDGQVTPAIVDGASLLGRVSALIETCRASGVAVMFAQTTAPSGRPYAKDVHGWEIHPLVAPLPGEEIFFKVGPSAFENPALEQSLQSRGVDELIVCGTWSEGCVSITCRGALKRGFGVSLAEDGHGTVREGQNAARAVTGEVNQFLQQRGATLRAVEEIQADLAGT